MDRTLMMWDRFLASDPGLNRFRNALRGVLTIAVALGAEWLFVRSTGALQVQTPGATAPAARAAAVAMANRDFYVIAMLLGAIIGLTSNFGVSDPTAKGQLATSLFSPSPQCPDWPLE
jgi:hypothetical protein